MIDRTIKKGDLVEFNREIVWADDALGLVLQVKLNPYLGGPAIVAEVLWYDGVINCQFVDDLCVSGNTQPMAKPVYENGP